MSRIILSRYDDGKEHVTVGWDHPCGGAFWQEWATQQEIDDAEKRLAEMEDDDAIYTGESPEYYQAKIIAETGVKREGGMFPGIKLSEFREAVPEDLRHLITDEVMTLLAEHAADPDSGYVGSPNHDVVDLTVKS